MILHHGTASSLRPVIAREGLRAGGHWTYLAQEVDVARRYCRARAAVEFMAGGAATGIVVTVEVHEGDVESDPWSAVEPGQYRTRDISPAAVVSIETIEFGWSRWPSGAPMLSLGLAAGLAEGLTLERARLDGQETWEPAGADAVARDALALERIVRASRR